MKIRVKYKPPLALHHHLRKKEKAQVLQAFALRKKQIGEDHFLHLKFLEILNKYQTHLNKIILTLSQRFQKRTSLSQRPKKSNPSKTVRPSNDQPIVSKTRLTKPLLSN